jgi:lipoprotein
MVITRRRKLYMIKTKLSVIILIAGAFLLSCGNKHSKDISSNFSEKV